MIGGGVSKNRVVISVADDQMAFLEQQADETGLGRAHVVRQALALLKSRVERAAAIEADVARAGESC